MDIFDLFGGINETITDGLVVEPARKMNDGKKAKDRKSVVKRNPAKRTKFLYPVTCLGRKFKVEVTGEGEISLQGLAEKLYELGYKEVAHERVRFVKLSDNLLMLDYQSLKRSESQTALILPVTIADGMLYTVMEKDETSEEDEKMILDLMELGLSDELYKGVSYDYDPTSGIALPIFPCEDAGNVSVRNGEMIHCFGNVETVENPAEVVDQMIGELPGNVSVVCYTGNNTHILYFKPVGKEIKLEKIDRSPFKVDESKKTGVVQEKITLPTVVYFVNFARKLTVTVQDMGGKKKVTWDELFSHIKGIEPIYAQADRRVDHLYDKESGTVSVAVFSGKKGCAHPAYAIEDGFIMSMKMPRTILEEVISFFAQDLTREAIVQIWIKEGKYYVVYPEFQDSTKSYVEYRFPVYSDGIYVMAIHSHNTMRPIPSCIDDRDELQVPGLYGIIGSISKNDEEIYYESFFRVTRLGKAPLIVDEFEIFEEEGREA